MSDQHEHDERRRVIQQLRDQQAAIVAAYQAMTAKQLKQALLVVFRCDDRACLLLHVWRSPHGLCFYKPPYKVERGRNLATSSESGRAANTTDGDRKWRADADVLSAARSWEGHKMRLDCDHLSLSVESAKIIATAEKAAPGHPARRKLGHSPL